MATADNKPVFDVSKPNKSAPTPTSRPVITAHGPMMKDPMVSDISESASKEDTKPAVVTREKVIVPLNAPEPAAEESKDTPAVESDNKEADKKEVEAAVVDAVAEQAGKKKKGEPSKEEVARRAEFEKMVEDKKYFVPIGQIKHRRHKHWFWAIFILLLLGLAGGYLAIDADLIDLGIKLPYELIP